MPWTSVTVEIDKDKAKVGTVTAIWDGGGPDEFQLYQ